MEMSALNISKIGPFDFAFGSNILHHIEPFPEFVISLRQAVRNSGKAFFNENNACSRLLIWFRKNVTGKYWIPKHRDEDEFPLTPNEVNELKKYFHVRISYPEFVFFRLISPYLLGGHLKQIFKFLDDLVYKIPSFRKYSYRQYLYLS